MSSCLIWALLTITISYKIPSCWTKDETSSSLKESKLNVNLVTFIKNSKVIVDIYPAVELFPHSSGSPS